MQLTPEQQTGISKAKDWFRNYNLFSQPIFKIFGYAGCVDKDEMILTNCGYKTMEDIIVSNETSLDTLYGFEEYKGKYKVYNGEKFTDISHVYGTNIIDGYKIIFDNGIDLSCSFKHPLLVLHEDGTEDWVQAKDIKIGDKVKTSKQSIGYEGSLDKKTFNLTRSSKKLYNEFKHLKSIKGYATRLALTHGNMLYVGSYEDCKFLAMSLQNLYIQPVVIDIHGNGDLHKVMITDDEMKTLISLLNTSSGRVIRSSKETDGYVTVTNIKELPPQRYYDITVPDGHQFICNGLYNHNTGKSTMVNSLIDYLGLMKEEVLFATYTGKASLVLRSKNLNSKTIHKSIYDNVQMEVEKEITIKGKTRHVIVEELVSIKKDKLDAGIKLIVIDEGSMPDDKIYTDLISFNIPIIVIADPFQIPSLQGENMIMREKPDIFLENIHRQALDSPIIWLSMIIREDRKMPSNGVIDGRLIICNNNDVGSDTLHKVDQILCSKNITRHELNAEMREYYGYDKISDLPVIGDKILCEQNQWDIFSSGKYEFPLMNGTIGKLTSNPKLNEDLDTIGFTFEADYSEPERYSIRYGDARILRDPVDSFIPKDLYRYRKDYFDRLRDFSEPNPNNVLTKFAYGYAITVHKSQGSEYNKVAVFDERFSSDTSKSYRQRLYTAVTRASKKLVLAR